MLVFHYVAHQYVDGHCVHDLTQGVQHVDDQMMDVLMIYVLGDLLLGALHDQCVVLLCVICRLLALMNENVQILELQRFHQLVSLRAA
jgi:hypothetical protein